MEFRVLGPLEVLDGGRPVALGGPREQTVLAALLLCANEIASVGHLVDAVWEHLPASPDTNLRTYVAGLRRRLGVARLVTNSGGYSLLVEPGSLDLGVFEDRVACALAAGSARTAAAEFGAALRLWRGAPLAGLRSGPGLRGELARLAERRLWVASRHAAALIDAGLYPEAIEDLRGLVGTYPLREELWAQLMIALSRAGRPAAALETYARARRRLMAELGVGPGPRLRGLHAEILRARS